MSPHGCFLLSLLLLFRAPLFAQCQLAGTVLAPFTLATEHGACVYPVGVEAVLPGITPPRGKSMLAPPAASADRASVSSGGLPGDAARCRELGIRADLGKPIRFAQLLETIQTVVGYIAGPQESSPLVRQHLLSENRYRQNIHLAEDHHVHPLLAAFHLEKDGHSVIAQNGKEALDLSATLISRPRQSRTPHAHYHCESLPAP